MFNRQSRNSTNAPPHKSKNRNISSRKEEQTQQQPEVISALGWRSFQRQLLICSAPTQLGMWAGGLGEICKSTGRTFLFQSRAQHRHGSTKHSRTCPPSLTSLVFSFFAAFNGRSMNISCNVAVLCNGRGMFSRPETAASAPEHHFIWQWLVSGGVLILHKTTAVLLCIFPLFQAQGRLITTRHRFIFFPLHFVEFIRMQKNIVQGWTVFPSLSMAPEWDPDKSTSSLCNTFWRVC